MVLNSLHRKLSANISVVFVNSTQTAFIDWFSRFCRIEELSLGVTFKKDMIITMEVLIKLYTK